jgi:hypothetical protein
MSTDKKIVHWAEKEQFIRGDTKGTCGNKPSGATKDTASTTTTTTPYVPTNLAYVKDKWLAVKPLPGKIPDILVTAKSNNGPSATTEIEQLKLQVMSLTAQVEKLKSLLASVSGKLEYFRSF